MIRKRRAVFPLLLAAILCIPGCKPTEKTEASVPAVSGSNVVMDTAAPNMSAILDTTWTNNLITLTISKDGKVHKEELKGFYPESMDLDQDGKPVISREEDGYIDGSYIIWTDTITYNYESKSDGTIISTNKVTSHSERVSCDLVTYISDRTLISQGGVYIRKK